MAIQNLDTKWHQETCNVFSSLRIYTDPPRPSFPLPTHTHTHNTKNIPSPKKMLHAMITFFYSSNKFAEQLKGEVTKSKIIWNSQFQVAIKQGLKICLSKCLKIKRFTTFIAAWSLLVASESFLLCLITHDSIFTCWSTET